jgi:hypothetical protein
MLANFKAIWSIYFTAIWYIIWPHLVYFVVILVYFSRSGMLHQEKSGNPGQNAQFLLIFQYMRTTLATTITCVTDSGVDSSLVGSAVITRTYEDIY